MRLPVAAISLGSSVLLLVVGSGFTLLGGWLNEWLRERYSFKRDRERRQAQEREVHRAEQCACARELQEELVTLTSLAISEARGVTAIIEGPEQQMKMLVDLAHRLFRAQMLASRLDDSAARTSTLEVVSALLGLVESKEKGTEELDAAADQAEGQLEGLMDLLGAVVRSTSTPVAEERSGAEA